MFVFDRLAGPGLRHAGVNSSRHPGTLILKAFLDTGLEHTGMTNKKTTYDTVSKISGTPYLILPSVNQITYDVPET